MTLPLCPLFAQDSGESALILTSKAGHAGNVDWQMSRCQDVSAEGSVISSPDFKRTNLLEAIVPGTVLNSLVQDGIYPEPYFGLNNAHEQKLIPDISTTGRDFYT